LEGLKIVVDCAHGAAYKVAPEVFEELGASVIPLGVDPDGMNINEKSGAMHPEAMCQAVIAHGAHLGIALDGDADRVIVADEQGRVVDGDVVMAICGLDLLARGQLKQDTLVATVMSNLGLDQCIARAGGRVVRAGVGDRYVLEQMRETGATFGGEQSGHLIFLDHATTGDGTVAALALLRVMVQSGKPLSELARCMTVFPQSQRNLKVREKPPLGSLPEVQRVIAEAEQSLGDQGRVLVRYSGTEKKVRVLVEGPEQQAIDSIADRISGALLAAIGA
jgi:phosphoglucosamine mutase